MFFGGGFEKFCCTLTVVMIYLFFTFYVYLIIFLKFMVMLG